MNASPAPASPECTAAEIASGDAATGPGNGARTSGGIRGAGGADPVRLGPAGESDRVAMRAAFCSSVVVNPCATPVNCSALATSPADSTPKVAASCAPAVDNRPAAPP